MAGVLGGCVWARFVVLSLFCRLFVVFVVGLWCRPAFGTCGAPCVFRLPPAVSGSGVRCGRACWARVSAVPRSSRLGCRGVFFALFFFFGCWVSLSRALWSLPTSPFFRAGLLAFFFFSWCVSACFGAPFPGGPLFLAWCCRFWLGGPPVPLWRSCLRYPLSGGFGRLFVLLAGGLVAVGCLRAPPPLPPPFFFPGGGAAWLFLPLPSLGWRSLCGWYVVWVVPRHSWQRFLCATPRHSWLGFAAGVGGRSPPLLTGVRWRRWCVVCGVWRWCVVWLVPRHSWRRFLCATPRHSWLGFAAGGGGRSPPLLAGVRWRRWFVVCGVWRWCVGGVVAGVWCGWSLATPGGGSCVQRVSTPLGPMQWKVVPMGAKNGNAAFQRMMEDLLGPVRDCADPFVDDIIIGSGTENMTEDELIDAHEKDLRRVLSELDKHNMVCKPTKASLFVKEVEFAGHVVGHGQRRPMPGKLTSLHHWEKPQTISELRSFMGFCNYYSGYVRMYAELSGPLHKMLQVGKFDGRKGSKKQLAWTPEAENAFSRLKERLLGQLGLFLVDPDKGFVLRTDASDYAVGAVLEQIRDDGSHVPVAFWSRILAEGQRRTWTAREKETYAIVCALRKWSGHIGLQPVVVCTDHQSLQSWHKEHVDTPSGPAARRAQWHETLAKFDLSVVYVPGKDNTVADCLS